MNERELALRREIFEAFARTGEPPEVDDRETLSSLADQHVVVLGDDGRILMAHPFSAPRRDATTVMSGGSTWYGNCGWDGLGLVHAFGLEYASVRSRDVAVRMWRGRPVDEALFHVLVPARDWWADPGYT
ncbi:MAG TPA: hypothetical protein VF587_09725 [Solirubrobacteraceae bacterium]